MAWFLLLIAGLFEVGWAIGLKYTEGFTKPLASVLTSSVRRPTRSACG
jgi:quaternary ammonium compound-resistance protein SugE